MNNPQRSRSLREAFQYAFAGIRYVLRTQRNAKIHLMVMTCVVLMGICLDLQPMEWALIVVAMAAVWLTEFINTALETIVDLASPDINPLARIAKDVCAGSVLLAALFSIIIGLLILGPPLWHKLIAIF